MGYVTPFCLLPTIHTEANHISIGFFLIRLGKVAGNTAIPKQGVGRLITRPVGCAIWGCAIWSLVRC